MNDCFQAGSRVTAPGRSESAEGLEADRQLDKERTPALDALSLLEVAVAHSVRPSTRWETIIGTAGNAAHRDPWNKGKIVGQKASFELKDIWALRVRLRIEGHVRERALFNLGIDSNPAAPLLSYAAVLNPASVVLINVPRRCVRPHLATCNRLSRVALLPCNAELHSSVSRATCGSRPAAWLAKWVAGGRLSARGSLCALTLDFRTFGE